MRTPLSFRFAWRELRSGVAGFRIFLACLALGVAAIAAAGSTAEAFRHGLAAQAREILGGDLRVSVEQRRFTRPERAAFEDLGEVAYAIGVRAMAQAPSGERRMVELRGVSEAYPLAGRVKLSGGGDLEGVFEPQDGAAGAAVEEALLERLGLEIGDVFVIGRSPFVVRAVQPLLIEMDREMEEAAASLGASGFTVFRRIVFPNLIPGLAAGVALAFARALGEFGSVLIFAGGLPDTQVSSVFIRTQVESGNTEGAAAVSMVLLLASLLCLLAISLIQRRANRHDEQR